MSVVRFEDGVRVLAEEYFAPGHRACIGCSEVLAVRLVCKRSAGTRSSRRRCLGRRGSTRSSKTWAPWFRASSPHTRQCCRRARAGAGAQDKGGGLRRRSPPPTSHYALFFCCERIENRLFL